MVNQDNQILLYEDLYNIPPYNGMYDYEIRKFNYVFSYIVHKHSVSIKIVKARRNIEIIRSIVCNVADRIGYILNVGEYLSLKFITPLNIEHFILHELAEFLNFEFELEKKYQEEEYDAVPF